MSEFIKYQNACIVDSNYVFSDKKGIKYYWVQIKPYQPDVFTERGI